MKEKQSQRFWELDALRGIAIILMVTYHAVFSLGYFFNININYRSGFWWWEGRVSAVLFIMLVGVASSLIAKKYQGVDFWKKQFKRSIRLLLFGLIITGITLLFLPERAIWFGILHFMAVGILLSSFFAKQIWINLFLASFFFGLGDYLATLRPDHYFGLIFGARPSSFQSVDYYPLFPHMAWIFVGIMVGNLIYHHKTSQPKLPKIRILNPLCWAGKYSLWIYMLHQPILLLILWLLLF